ncbi:MAG: rod shape-determining protein MreD [Alphaproteobacteria bacterium]|nr:rod shape-determining protein MreD [Alphaproteobacteria bacterium]
MANALSAKIWFGQTAFALSAAAIMFVGLVPLDFTPGGVPWPDLMLGLTYAILLRRPEFVPIWLIAAVFFIADILMMRPPGLWTAIVLLSCEFSRNQISRLRELPFPFEWAFVAGTMFLAILANRLVLAITLLAVPNFGATMLYYFVTVLAYPAIVFFCYFVLRIRRITPNEAIRYGHSL